MRDDIREKLNRLDELYPANRIAASKERWRRLWAGEPPLDRLPFMVGPAPGHSYYSAGISPEHMLQQSLDGLVIHGRVCDDFIPALFPGCHQGTLPGMFGAKEVIVEGDYSCERMLASAGAARTLPHPCVLPGSVAQGWLDMQQYFLEETDGRIPIHVADMQGPFDVAGQLLGYDDLMVAAYEDPDSYHALMSLTTEAFLIFWKIQEQLLGDRFVGTHLWGWSWVPPGNGATASVDSLVMFSPGFYTEHVQPYLEMLAQKMGGVVTHSCGNFAGVVPALCLTKGLRGVNASQMTLRQLLDAGLAQGKVAVINVGFQMLQETAALIAERRQPAEISVFDIWPDDNPNAWDAAQWAEIRQKVEHATSVMTQAAGVQQF